VFRYLYIYVHGVNCEQPYTHSHIHVYTHARTHTNTRTHTQTHQFSHVHKIYSMLLYCSQYDRGKDGAEQNRSQNFSSVQWGDHSSDADDNETRAFPRFQTD